MHTFIYRHICIYIYICAYGYPEAPRQNTNIDANSGRTLFKVIQNKAPWDSFCRLLEPMRNSHRIEFPGAGSFDFWSQDQKVEPPGIRFVDYWSQGQKVIKASLLGMVLSTSGAKARKSLNRGSWD